jgi:hypothetical protein
LPPQLLFGHLEVELQLVLQIAVATTSAQEARNT